MKDILVIDDERIFPFVGHNVVYARSMHDALGELSRSDWDEVWFDHDLGDGDRDGTAIVKWMIDKHRNFDGVLWHKKIGRAYVHTMNVATADTMRSRIKDFGIPTFRVGLPMGTTVVEAS